MRKLAITVGLCALNAAGVLAGGYLTNTNQSVSFLRNPARDAVIAIDGAYFNPAGVSFMTPGWHMAFNIQSAYQSRSITSAFGQSYGNLGLPFSTGIVNGRANAADGSKFFDGKAKAPVIPSIELARVGEHWTGTFHFGITGGGGKCNFDDGLPSFESQVAMLPVLVNILSPNTVTNYTMDTHMQGRQYYFGGQFGIGYKFTPNLSVNVGGRVIYADCNYYGYVRNIGVGINTPAGVVNMPASDFFTAQNMPHFAAVAEDRELNCDQTGWGFTPIISVDYKTGKWNFAAKYEFKTRLRLKNRSGVNTSGLSEFDDGKKIAADIPAILTLGAQYEILDNLRASAGFHYYFDKQATQYENKEEHLDGGGWEVLAGLELDLNKRWTVSAGWQTTNYGLGEDSRFVTDMSFVTNSNSVGLGATFRLKERVKLNFAYFKTFYQHYRKNQPDYTDLKTKFGGMLGEMGTQLTAAKAQLTAYINSGAIPAEQLPVYQQQLAVVNGELGALGAINRGMANYSTAGFDNFHRTNDVFGIGLEIDF